MQRNDEKSTLEFGYWKVKFKAHYIRYLIRYLKLEVKEYSPNTELEWRRKKDKLYKLNPLIAIPYFRDGDLVVSRLGSIGMAICMRANRKDMLGTKPKEVIKMRTLQSAIEELTDYAYRLCYRSKSEIKKKFLNEVGKKIHPIIRNFNEDLGDKNFLMGDKVTLVDFEFVHIMELYDWITATAGVFDPFEGFENLFRLRKNLFSLDGVREYVKSKENKDMVWFKPGGAVFDRKE